MVRKRYAIILGTIITTILVVICVTSFVKKIIYFPRIIILLCFVGIAIVVIGYPIYALAKWSDHYLKLRQQKRK